jgi:hypothetical protein
MGRIITCLVVAVFALFPVVHAASAADATVTNSNLSLKTPAQDEMPQTTAEPFGPEMNGIRYNDYLGFQDKWKLVTVHYRTDTGELRFVYANPEAYAALTAGQTDYPAGAVFAKIAVVSEDDPEFVDSKIPMGALRNQFMVRDKVKYAETGGWGFAVFAPHPQVVRPELASNDPANCFACHQVAKDRGFVFSFPARLTQDPSEAMHADIAPHAPMLNFSDYALENVPANIRALLPASAEKVRFLAVPGASDAHLVYIGEFRPMLIQEAAKSGLPALYFSNAAGSFIVVIPLKQDHLPNGSACPAGQKAYETYGSEHFSNIGQYFCN